MPKNSTGPQEREKQNASKLVALRNFNEQLLSIAEEQQQQIGACAQSSSTHRESEAEEHGEVRPKTTTALVEIANISQQHAALQRKAVLILCQAQSMSEEKQQPTSQCNISRGGRS